MKTILTLIALALPGLAGAAEDTPLPDACLDASPGYTRAAPAIKVEEEVDACLDASPGYRNAAGEADAETAGRLRAMAEVLEG